MIEMLKIRLHNITLVQLQLRDAIVRMFPDQNAQIHGETLLNLSVLSAQGKQICRQNSQLERRLCQAKLRREMQIQKSRPHSSHRLTPDRASDNQDPASDQRRAALTAKFTIQPTTNQRRMLLSILTKNQQFFLRSAPKSRTKIMDETQMGNPAKRPRRLRIPSDAQRSVRVRRM